MTDRIVLGGNSVEIDRRPNTCPHCGRSIRANELAAHRYAVANEGRMDLVFTCPDERCNRAFVANYSWDGFDFITQKIIPAYLSRSKYPDAIEKTYPEFVKIYDEAWRSEQQGYLKICGMGYRKALEFLIKDHLIKTNPKDAENIKAAMLGPCIKRWLAGTKTEIVAERAAWLGNDETHYIRKWEDKDVQYLKKLIDVTVFWIEADIMTDEALREMPAGKPKAKP